MLVIMIDQDVRPASPYSSACTAGGGLGLAAWFGGRYPPWLSWSLPRPATRFWPIFTPEVGISQDAMRSNCLATGFPPTALDVISISPVAFYEPWAADLNARYPDLMTRADFCSSMTGHFPARALADDWAKVLRAQVGLP